VIHLHSISCSIILCSLYILYVYYSIYYCHFGKLLDSWYVGMYVCMFEGHLVIFSSLLCHPFLDTDTLLSI